MTKQRNINLDLIRTLAIFFVILVHATEIVYSLKTNDWMFKYGTYTWNKISYQSSVFMITLFTIGRLGVPLFLFLTGSLIISKKFDDDKDLLTFYKKNLIPLVIVNTVWIFIYNIIMVLNKNMDSFNIGYVLQESLLLMKIPIAHMWYFPMIIGLYLVLPFISKVLKSFSKKSINIVLIVIFLYLFMVPMINIIMALYDKHLYFEPVINLSFFGGVYGLYAIIGYLIYSNNKDRFNNRLMVLFGIVSLLLTILIQIYSYASNHGYNVWYNFPFLLICSACLFILLLKLDLSKFSNIFKKFITYTSRVSLGMFFIHIIILFFLNEYMFALNIMLPLKVIILYLVTLILTYLVIFVLSKIKFISKYVLLIKN